MVITDQNRVMSSNGTRIITNDAVDFFLGSVSTDWNNPLNWSLGIVPTNSHVVYIYANCVLAVTTTLKGLIIETGYTLTQTTGTLTINSNLEVYGSFNYAGNIFLQSSVTSFISRGGLNFTQSTTQVFTIQAIGLTLPASLILPTLNTTASGTIFQSGDLTIMGDFLPYNVVFDVGPYNFTVMGASQVNGGGIKKASGTGSVLLVGKVSTGAKFFSTMTGNPTIEMRGGFEMTGGSSAPAFSNANDFTVKCTTNNQTFTIPATASFTCTNLIADNVIVTINDSNSSPLAATASNLYVNGLLIKGKLDGTTPGSLINMNTTGQHAPLVNAAFAPMQTAGTMNLVNADGNRNIAFYYGSGSVVVSSAWGNTFDYLYLTTQQANTGTATIAFTQSLTINKGLDLRGYAIMDMGSNNLTILGTTYINYNSNFNNFITGSGAANWLFVGACTFGRRAVNLTGQSVNLEFRGGITTEDTSLNGANLYDLGNGTVKFTTNDQSFNINGLKVSINNLLIAPGLNLTLISNQQGVNVTACGTFNITGSVEGQSSGSKVISKAYINNATAGGLMNTGTLDLTSFANTFYYSYSGAYTLKGGSYWHLYIANATGATAFNKTLSGDLTTLGDLRTASAGTSLILGSYNLTVYGVATIANILNKTGSGTLLFIGAVAISIPPALSLSNVTIECRGGFTYSGTTGATLGQLIKLTTNNQNISFSSANTVSTPILIDSGMIVTNIGTLVTTASINGVDATAMLINTSIIDFRTGGAIMATGKLYCDTAANTVTYNTTFGQTISIPADGNYRNLTLTGNPSTKTVASPGTVNVRGTFTKNAGVTVVGTITNNP